jgi:hypothetical protein
MGKEFGKEVPPLETKEVVLDETSLRLPSFKVSDEALERIEEIWDALRHGSASARKILIGSVSRAVDLVCEME